MLLHINPLVIFETSYFRLLRLGTSKVHGLIYRSRRKCDVLFNQNRQDVLLSPPILCPNFWCPGGNARCRLLPRANALIKLMYPNESIHTACVDARHRTHKSSSALFVRQNEDSARYTARQYMQCSAVRCVVLLSGTVRWLNAPLIARLCTLLQLT